MSSFLRYHGLQHTRFTCPSLFPGVCSNSRPLSWWCYLFNLLRLLLLLPSIFPSIRVFSSESVLHIRWPKEYIKAVYCHPAYLTYAEYIMRNAGLEEAQARIKICQEKYQLPQMCRWHHPYGRKWRGTKKPLDESERGQWKSWLKVQHSENEDHGIWSHYFIGNRWGNSGNSVRLYFGGAPKSLQMVIAAMKLKGVCSSDKKLWST